MQLTNLDPSWTPTRSSLQAYARAMTAVPRAGAPHDPRWSHVAMDPHPAGFVTWPTPLADGTDLVSVLDLERHVASATAGDDSIEIDLTSGPSSRPVGEAILELARAHGLSVEVDDERFGSADRLTYDRAAATSFLDAARVAVGALEAVNATLNGEIAGPHLWPHGFDVATEWFAEQMVPFGDGEANAQIGIGWYPAAESYIYVNPWPFRAEYEDIELPGGATWHDDGWQGAKLDITPPAGVSTKTVVAVGSAVHEATRPTLGT